MQQLFCLLTRSSLSPTHHPNKCPAKWHSVQCKLEVSYLRDGTLLEIPWRGFHTFFDNIHYYVDFIHHLCLLKLWLKYAYLVSTFVSSCVHMEGVLTTIWGRIHFQWSPHECSLLKKKTLLVENTDKIAIGKLSPLSSWLHHCTRWMEWSLDKLDGWIIVFRRRNCSQWNNYL